MKKVNSFQIYERKWYLLLPIQDILDIINWSRISDGSTFTSATWDGVAIFTVLSCFEEDLWTVRIQQQNFTLLLLM